MYWLGMARTSNSAISMCMPSICTADGKLLYLILPHSDTARTSVLARLIRRAFYAAPSQLGAGRGVQQREGCAYTKA